MGVGIYYFYHGLGLKAFEGRQFELSDLQHIGKKNLLQEKLEDTVKPVLHKLFAITRTVTHSAKRLMFRLNYGDNFKQNRCLPIWYSQT
jgi:hypothetical protein